MTTEGKPMASHRADDPPIRISREVPLPWLIGGAVGLIINITTMWIGMQNLTQEVKELHAAATQGGLQSTEFRVKLDEHERRIQSLEVRKSGSL
jgi:hypothetical protein